MDHCGDWHATLTIGLLSIEVKLPFKFLFYKINSSLKFEIKAKQFYAASQRVL